MMNSQQEDSKDTNAEGNDSCSFDVLGTKICLTLYKVLFVLFVCLFFPMKSFASLASGL